MLIGFLLVLLVLVCIALSTVILLQKSEGGAFGMGGSSSGILTARGAGDLLTRTTAVLAGVFFALCLLLTILTGHLRSGESVVDRLKVDALNPDSLNRANQTPARAPAATTPPVGASPLATPQPGQPARPTFEAPAPQVHTAPAAQPTRAPAVTTDSGARAPVSDLLGYQSAPQATPTVAPHAVAKPTSPPATTASPPPAAPAASTPASSTAAAGNTAQ